MPCDPCAATLYRTLAVSHTVCTKHSHSLRYALRSEFWIIVVITESVRDCVLRSGEHMCPPSGVVCMHRGKYIYHLLCHSETSAFCPHSAFFFHAILIIFNGNSPNSSSRLDLLTRAHVFSVRYELNSLRRSLQSIREAKLHAPLMFHMPPA